MLFTASGREINSSELVKDFKDEILLTTHQAALFLQVSVSALNHWRSDNFGPTFIKLGQGSKGPIRYTIGDLRAYVESRRSSSKAKANLDSAMQRVSSSLRRFDYEHPFVVRSRWFLVDSAYSSEELYMSIFRDPYIKLAWMTPEDALARPWVREDVRQELLQDWLKIQIDPQAAIASLEVRYKLALENIPDEYFGSHPYLTMAYYQERLESRIRSLMQ